MLSYTIQDALYEAEKADECSVPVPFPYSDHDWVLYTGSNINDFEEGEVVLMAWLDYGFEFLRASKKHEKFFDVENCFYRASSDSSFDEYTIYRHVDMPINEDEIEVLSSDLDEVL